MYNYHIPFSSLLVIIKAHVKIDLLSAWVPRFTGGPPPFIPSCCPGDMSKYKPLLSLCLERWDLFVAAAKPRLSWWIQSQNYTHAFNTTQMEGTLEMVKSQIRFQSILNWTSEDQRAPRNKEAISPHSSVRIHALTSRRAAWSSWLPEQPGENSPSSASPHTEGRF